VRARSNGSSRRRVPGQRSLEVVVGPVRAGERPAALHQGEPVRVDDAVESLGDTVGRRTRGGLVPDRDESLDEVDARSCHGVPAIAAHERRVVDALKGWDRLIGPAQGERESAPGLVDPVTVPGQAHLVIEVPVGGGFAAIQRVQGSVTVAADGQTQGGPATVTLLAPDGQTVLTSFAVQSSGPRMQP